MLEVQVPDILGVEKKPNTELGVTMIHRPGRLIFQRLTCLVPRIGTPYCAHGY
jgi:hypothetical protein